MQLSVDDQGVIILSTSLAGGIKFGVSIAPSTVRALTVVSELPQVPPKSAP